MFVCRALKCLGLWFDFMLLEVGNLRFDKKESIYKHFLDLDDVSDSLFESLAIVSDMPSRIRFLFLSRGTIPHVEMSFEYGKKGNH